MIINEVESLINEISDDFIRKKLGGRFTGSKWTLGDVFGRRTTDLFISANQLAHAKRGVKKTGKPIPPDMQDGVRARLRAAHVRAKSEKAKAIEKGIYNPRPNKGQYKSQSTDDLYRQYSGQYRSQSTDDLYRRAREASDRMEREAREARARAEAELRARANARARREREIDDVINGMVAGGVLGAGIYSAKKIKDTYDKNEEKIEDVKNTARGIKLGAAGIGAAGLGAYGFNKYYRNKNQSKSESNNINN
jgi:hypothetical protein